MTKLLRVSTNSLNWSPLSGATWALLESMGAWHLALQLKRRCQTVQMGSLPSACTTLSAPSLPVFLNGPPLQIPMYLYSKPQLTAIVHVGRLLIKETPALRFPSLRIKHFGLSHSPLRLSLLSNKSTNSQSPTIWTPTTNELPKRFNVCHIEGINSSLIECSLHTLKIPKCCSVTI
jgi:hypothetical protein